jgi:molybdopterin converting factor subunit 1
VQVRIRLFAGLRERAGTDELELDLPEGAVVRDALERMSAVTDGLPVVMAVNQEYADVDLALHAGDEVALIPPVSGGAVGALHARVTTEPLTLDPLVELVRDPRAGAVVTFLGVTREVPELEYEAYAPMAVAEMRRVASELCAEVPGIRLAVLHRVGMLEVGESAVVCAASAPHRGEAFRACRALIDRVKERVPIWKREHGPEGAYWVGWQDARCEHPHE